MREMGVKRMGDYRIVRKENGRDKMEKLYYWVDTVIQK